MGEATGVVREGKVNYRKSKFFEVFVLNEMIF